MKSASVTTKVASMVCFISILVPVNFASDFANVTLGADAPGTGRDPGLFDLFPNFPRPFKIIAKPTPGPNKTQTIPKPQKGSNRTQSPQKQTPSTGSVEIPANLTLPLPVSLGGTTQAAPVSVVSETVPASTDAPWLGQIKYPCSCDGGTCGCCTGRILQNFNINFQQRGCVNVTYFNEDFEFHVRMIWNDRVFYQRRMSGKNPPPLCIPLPRVVNLKFCVKFSNIYMIGRNMHMCIDIEGLLVEYQVFAFSFDCIRLGSNGFAVVRPEDGGGLGPPPDEDPYIPKPKPTKPPKPPKPQSTKPKPPPGSQSGNKPNKPKPDGTTTEDYDAIVASEGDEIDSAKSAVQL
nr:PREDICTED: uncharacterized protein LOC109038913 [Bemisia tabaci]